ncbi:MAG TPA: M48 family metallopeptidase [Chthonomonas sp.]|uniref:M48 family metallopeptidase n=1 Tax=Chthonomonas sp. TaxID=2282153 RepID=UPI002B4B7941|nr:M48 family metallopeptidase [Chthonomonas sp.]HLH80343.1 M48 family metallopeptidase [Chthonomonas sp.]
MCQHKGCCGNPDVEKILGEIERKSRRQFLRELTTGGLLVALATMDEQARADIFMPSISEQKKVGQQAERQILQQYRVVHGPQERWLQRVGERLRAALDEKDRRTWDYRFHVIESKEINAFALPGGPIFMFTGLMDRIHDDSELAAVTGHEMTHVRLQHWARRVATQRKEELGFLGIVLLTHANRTLQSLGDLALSAIDLKYSRDEEKQADIGGLEDMVAAGYNPNGMLELFDMLEQATKGHPQPPEFLSDHPLTQERIRYVQQLIQEKYSAYTDRPM